MAEELHGVQLALNTLAGEVKALVARVDGMEKGRDKDSAQLLALLAPRLDAMDKNSDRQENELGALKVQIDRRWEEVDQSITAQVTSHTHEDAPHDKTLGVRVGKIELKLSFYAGALGVLSIVMPVAAALLTKQLGG